MVNQAYKGSEVGKIPSDWSVKQIGKIGYTYSGLTGKEKSDFGKGESRYITFLNVLNNPILRTDIFEKVSVSEGEHQNLAHKGDLFFNTSSETPEEVGICALLNDDVPNLYLNSFCFGYRLTDPEVDGLFLSYFFRSKLGRDIMTMLAQGATRYNLSKESFNKTLIAFPPFEEQKRIAEALSGFDDIIGALDEAIEKKRQIKEGLMQNLLTGRTRLPGFNEKWIDVRLRDVCMMNSGGTPSTSDPHFYGGDILFLSISDMTNSGKYIYSTEKRITEDGYNCSSARMFPAGTLMYAMYASLGKCAITKVDVAVSQAILGFHSLKNIDTEYLYYYLASLEKYVKQTGQTGTQSNLSKNIVENFQLAIPSLEEQQAIASLLRTVDDDIDCCITKREKYNLIKQGMMQELLTGKTRLI